MPTGQVLRSTASEITSKPLVKGPAKCGPASAAAATASPEIAAPSGACGASPGLLAVASEALDTSFTRTRLYVYVCTQVHTLCHVSSYCVETHAASNTERQAAWQSRHPAMADSGARSLNSPSPTCRMLGCDSAELMAASMMAMRSCRERAPLGSTMDLTATTVPRQMPLYNLPNCGYYRCRQTRRMPQHTAFTPFSRAAGTLLTPAPALCLPLVALCTHRAFSQTLQQLGVADGSSICRSVAAHDLLPCAVDQLRHRLLPRPRQSSQRRRDLLLHMLKRLHDFKGGRVPAQHPVQDVSSKPGTASSAVAGAGHHLAGGSCRILPGSCHVAYQRCRSPSQHEPRCHPQNYHVM